MKLQAPAKINLFLQITKQRDDGYHELCSLMCAVDWYDTLIIEMNAARNTLHCNDPRLPSDETNLALKAVLRFNQQLTTQTDITPLAAAIWLTKRIPIGAGLGGGSSDAAAVLKGLNQYYNQPFSNRQLQAIALDLGTDVPFFINPTPHLATGVGEQLTPYPYLADHAVVIIFPGIAVSTAQAYKNLNLALTKCEKQLRYHLFKNMKFDASRHLCNDLETAVIECHPEIDRAKKALVHQGATGSLMTGSGSAVFGLFDNSTAAQKARDALTPESGWIVTATRLLV